MDAYDRCNNSEHPYKHNQWMQHSSLSSHGSTLTRDGGWYYLGTKKVATTLGALNLILTFMSNRSLCQLHLKDVWMVSALYYVCAVYL